MPLHHHALATDMDVRLRPFFSLMLVEHLAQLMHQMNVCDNDQKCIEENYSMLKDSATRLAKQADEEFAVSAPGKKTTYMARLTAIDEQASAKKMYKKGAKLIYREIMRIMCAVRSADQRKVVKIVDPDEGARLLHQTLCVLKDTSSKEANVLKELEVTIRAGCGSSGEVFMEKHKLVDGVEHIETYIYGGVLSELFCSYVNAYVTNAKDEDEGDKCLEALLQFFAIHPLHDVETDLPDESE